MTSTWISPWSGKELIAEELLHEVALDALSHYYVLSMLGLPEPEFVLEAESISLGSSTIDYNYVIYFPRELYNEMELRIREKIAALRSEFLIALNDFGSCKPGGERLGSVLTFFNSLDRLIRIASARKCWPPNRVLIAHGIPLHENQAELITELKNAEISYLLISPKTDGCGCGSFKSVGAARAIDLVNKLWHKQWGEIQKFFDLESDYGECVWLSNNNNWAVD